MKKIILFSFLLLSAIARFPGQTVGSTWECAHPRYFSSIMSSQARGSYSGYYQQLENDVQNYIALQQVALIPPSTYTIPVVVHVLHDGDPYGWGSNITLEQIEWQIAALNTAFAANYPSYNGQANGPGAVNTGIRFCLATNPMGVDLAGNPLAFSVSPWTGQTECGVMRYNVPDSLLHFNMNNMTAAANTMLAVTHPTPSAFPFANYLNVWLVDDFCPANCGVMGVGTFPGTTPLDGIIIRADVFGDASITSNVNTFNLIQALDKGRIFVHEVGHYLNLFHTFHPNDCVNFTGVCAGFDDSNCSTTGDLVCDTPPSTICTNTNNCGQVSNTCADNITVLGNTDQNDLLDNFMSYADDDCMRAFTAGQAIRMQATLNSPLGRQSLVDPANLLATGVSATPICDCGFLSADYSYAQGSSCGEFSFLAPEASSLSGVTYTWDFGDGSPTVTGLSPTHIFSAPGTYFVVLIVSDANGNTVAAAQQISVIGTAAIINHQHDTICEGDRLTLQLHFTGNPPFVATLSDGTQTITVNTNHQLETAGVLVTGSPGSSSAWAITGFTANGCVGAIDTSMRRITVSDCSCNMFVNGDFAVDTILPSTSSLTYSTNGYPSAYGIITNSPGQTQSWHLMSALPAQGSSMIIDQFPSFQSSSPVNHNKVICQDINLRPNTNYRFDFESSGDSDFNPYSSQPATQEIEWGVLLNNSVFAGPFVRTIKQVPVDDWISLGLTFNSGLLSGTTNVCLCQTSLAGGGGGGSDDYYIDNIRIRAMNPPPLVSAGDNDTICRGSSTILQATGSFGGTPYHYLWQPGNDTTAADTVAPLVTQDYIVLLTDYDGCTATDTVKVVVDQISLNAGADLQNCPGQNSALSATVTGGYAAYAYNWTPSASLSSSTVSNPVASATVTTTYSVTVTDHFGCTASDDVMLTITGISAAAGNDVTVCPLATAQLSASGSNGTAPYTFSWSPAAGLSSTNSSNPVANPAATTNYTVTVTDANGCTATDVIMVTVNTLQVNAGPNANSCPGTGVQLSATVSGGVAGYTYSWSPASGLSSTTVSNPVADPSGTTNYTVTVTDASGCTASDVVQVSPASFPLAEAGPDAAVCPGKTVALSAFVNPAYSYSWSPAAGLSSTTIPNPLVTPGATTTYTLTVSNGICTDDDQVTVTVLNGSPLCSNCVVANPGFEDQLVCPDDLSELSLLSTWFAPTQGSSDALSTCSPAATAVHLPSTAFGAPLPMTGPPPGGNSYAGFWAYGSLREYIETELNCELEANQQYDISFYSYIGSAAQNGINNIGMHLSAAPVTAANSALLSLVPQVVTVTPQTSSNGWVQVHEPAYMGNGEKFITIGNFFSNGATNTVPNGGSSSSTYVLIDNVTIVPVPPAISASSTNLSCGGCATLTASGSPAYSWTDGTNTWTGATINVCPHATTTYTVTGLIACNNCGPLTNTITITVSGGPTVDAGPNISKGGCPPPATLQPTVTGTGPFTYSWQPAAGMLPSGNVPSPQVSPTVTTTYTLTVTDGNGCTASDVMTITIIPSQINVSAANNSICQGSGTGTQLHVTYGNGQPIAGTCIWSPSAGIVPANSPNPVATPTVTTTYTVTAIDPNTGCPASTSITISVVPNTIVADAGQDIVICPGGSASFYPIVPAGSFTYSWQPAATLDNAAVQNPLASPAVTTTYTMTISSGVCSASDAVTLNILAAGDPLCQTCLVPNPGFETNSSCPNGASQASLASTWFIPTLGSSDAYNACSNNINSDVPINSFGNVPAMTAPPGGNGYLGFWAYSSGQNYREYIESKLNCTLIPGQRYNISFYTYIAPICSLGFNNIGMHLSAAAVVNHTSQGPLGLVPQLVAGSALTTANGWTQLSLNNYTGNGENYITIGNFSNDAATATTANGGSQNIGYAYVDNISVTPVAPTLTASSTTTNCGSCATLTATGTGAGGCTWTDGTTTWNNTNSIVVCPQVTTTYTATPVLNCVNCPNISSTITITVQTLDAGPDLTACPGQLVQLNATGATAYAWGISSGTLTGATTASPSFTYAGGTVTVTVVGAMPGGGSCTDMVIVSPAANCCPGPNAPMLINSSNANALNTGAPMAINQNIVVSGPGTFILNSPNVNIQATRSITLTNGATLNITNNSWLHACGCMWDGIYVNPGCTLNVNGNSLVEDAENAVVSAGGGNYNLNTAIFNKNYKAVVVQPYTGGNHPGTIINTVISCRNLVTGITHPSVATLKGSTFLSGQLAAYPVGTYTAATLSCPHLLSRSYTGFEITDVGTESVNPADHQLLNVTEIVIGQQSSSSAQQFARLNVFDNLDFGVRAADANVSLYCNAFQNITGFPSSLTPQAGSAVYATSQNNLANSFDRLQVNKGFLFSPATSSYNTFYECRRAVDVNDYYDIRISYNHVYSQQTFSPIFLFQPTGTDGFYMTTGYFGLIAVLGNELVNVRTGVYLNHGYINSTTDPQITNYAHIVGNTFRAAYSGSPGLKYMLTAVIAQRVAPPNCPGVCFTFGHTHIDNNLMDQVFNGISISGWREPPRAVDNVINLRQNTSFLFNPDQFGIYITNNVSPAIYRNTITGPGTLKAGLRGIYVVNNPASLVACNTISNTGQAMVFEGFCNVSTVTNNAINTARDGWVLLNNGIIGQQGMPISSINPQGIPADNTWSGTFSNSSTLTQNTCSNMVTLSGMYVRNINTGPVVHWPGVNATSCTPIGLNMYNIVNSIHVLPTTSTTVPAPFDCINTPAPAIAAFGSDHTPPSALQTLEQMAEGTLPLSAFEEESRWLHRQYVYNELRKNPGLREQSAVLENFWNNAAGSSFAKLAEAEDAFASHDIRKAAEANGKFTATVMPERNQQDYNRVLTAYTLNRRLDENEHRLLETIAAQCVVNGGEAVDKARSLLNLADRSSRSWEEKCAPETASFVDGDAATRPGFRLFPNPNNGDFVLEYHLGTGESGELQLFDVTGRLLLRENFGETTGELPVNAAKLEAGIYIAKVLVNGAPVHSEQVVIVK